MRKLWLIFSQATTVAMALLFVVGTLKPQWLLRDGQLLTEVVSLRTAPAVLAPPLAASAGMVQASFSG